MSLSGYVVFPMGVGRRALILGVERRTLILGPFLIVYCIVSVAFFYIVWLASSLTLPLATVTHALFSIYISAFRLAISLNPVLLLFIDYREPVHIEKSE